MRAEAAARDRGGAAGNGVGLAGRLLDRQAGAACGAERLAQRGENQPFGERARDAGGREEGVVKPVRRV